MSSEVLFFVGILAELILLFGSYKSGGLWGLRIVSIVNMLLITFFGAKLMSVFGVVSNVGNIFYASVLLSQAVIYEIWGYKEAVNSIFVIFLSTLVALVLGQLLISFPVIAGNENNAAAILQTLSFQPNIFVASFFAFFIVQTAFLKLYTKIEKYHLAIRYGVNAIFVQLLDSLIFFPIAFLAILPPTVVWELGVNGFIIKASIAIFSIWFVKLITKDRSIPEFRRMNDFSGFV